jgi:hypothetical protein
VLELIDVFDRPVRPFGLDQPTRTVAKYCAKDLALWGPWCLMLATQSDKFEGQVFVPAPHN